MTHHEHEPGHSAYKPTEPARADKQSFEFEDDVTEKDKKPQKQRGPIDGIVRERKPIFFVPVTLWVIGAFFLSSTLVGVALLALRPLGISSAHIDQNVFNTAVSVAIYIVLLAMTLGVPRALKLWSGRIEYPRLLGLTRLLQYRDIGKAILGFIIYIALGTGVSILLQAVPGYNATQVQDTGFKSLNPTDGLLVFFILVVVAPVAEEIIFRGYLFGTLRRTVPTWAAILITSALFGAIHGQWNVGIDVFVMSVVSCVLRLRTGSLWPSILLHMMKNGLAFYLMFVAPNLTV